MESTEPATPRTNLTETQSTTCQACGQPAYRRMWTHPVGPWLHLRRPAEGHHHEVQPEGH